ncbi:hypothetical protein PHAVU_011G081600 [Phaseolus vulgaris]|uniref:Acidic protein n=1 Tax=Phaseolus vulgaris TaxID=3885 RepID=V7AFG9_PHAVU|nr:hypothetical protein PHAVU_011G081600g [Phaseolus vulgaris]ESW04274.1 hypothetical protein PHAVU_011G081600g [Phaseolus vulgaris]
MAKSEMKSIGVVIVMMMMLGFSEADYGLSAQLTCPARCGINCLLANIAYPICFAACVAHCPKMSKDAFHCISQCGINKSININIDATGAVTKVLDSCLQNCRTS